jgi:hypothetical protein
MGSNLLEDGFRLDWREIEPRLCLWSSSPKVGVDREELISVPFA